MECVRKSWLILMCSSNELLKNGLDFFAKMESYAPNTKGASCNRNKNNIMDLHKCIQDMKKKLDALDEDLWRCFTTDISIEVKQNPNIHTNLIPIAKTAISTSIQSDVPRNTVVQKSNPVKSFNASVIDNMPEKLKSRYEGLPYPPNAIVYDEEDVKRDSIVFLEKFPVKENETSLKADLKSKESCEREPKLNQSESIEDNSNANTERRPGRLSLGPPRKPRGSKPHPFQTANNIQKDILSKPSLLAEPRKKRQLLDQGCLKEEDRSHKIRKVNTIRSEEISNDFRNVIVHEKLKKVDKIEKSQSLSAATKISKPKGTTQKKGQSKSQEKCGPELTKSEDSPKKSKESITDHFVAKKAHRSMHSRSCKKLKK